MEDLAEGCGGCLVGLIKEVLAALAIQVVFEAWSQIAGSVAGSISNHWLIKGIVWVVVFLAPCPICGGLFALITGSLG